MRSPVHFRSPVHLVRRFDAYRRRQRRLLDESNHPRGGGTPQGRDGSGRTSLPPDGVTPVPATSLTESGAASSTEDVLATVAAAVREETDPNSGHGLPAASVPDRTVPYGLAGRPFDRQSPFYFGFLATLGALVAWTLFTMAGRLTTTMTILVVAFFLTLALNPIVEWLLDRGLRRALAVLVVFTGLMITLALIGMLVVPPVVSEGSALLGQAPEYVNRALQTPWLQRLDAEYEIVQRAQEELTKRLQDGSLATQVLGGVLGAGRVVLNGVFQLFTVLILTLYFLATLPRIKQVAYAAVPASRRPRIVSLTEEIMRRTGAYAAGQGLVATINALASYIMMTVVGVPYAAVLAVVVGLLGLIPMVGATLGAIVVGVIALFTEPRMALIVGIYYVVYQQVENYVIVPRIMTSTVSVPGAVTIVAALAGGTLLGVIGALLAIPVAAGLLLLYEEVLLPRQRQH